MSSMLNLYFYGKFLVPYVFAYLNVMGKNRTAIDDGLFEYIF